MEYSYSYHDAMERLPIRKQDVHKGICGKTLVIAGSRNMCGAAYLAGKAAYRSGAGLVYIYTEECNRVILQQLLPEAVLVTYEEECWERQHLVDIMKDMNSIAAGPGLGQSDVKKKIIREVLMANEKKRVLDADALNILSADESLWHLIEKPLIVTPHLREMERLSGISMSKLKENLTVSACRFASEHNVITVLKDANTRVSDGSNDCYVNVTGNHGMATGGSGDVLTGVIAGLAAQGLDLFEAAKLGVCIHGIAGDTVKEMRGARSMMAGEIADAVLYGIS